MKCYQYLIFNGEHTIQSGYLTASNDSVLEKKLAKEIIPKVNDFSHVKYSQVFCEKCDSEYDVSHFQIENSNHILCKNCLDRLLIHKKSSAYNAPNK